MSTIQDREGPLTHIRQVIRVLNELIADINTCLSGILTGTPNYLSGYDNNGDACDVEPSTGLDLVNCVLTVDLSDFTTDDLPEGITNLYFTDERVDDRVANLIQDSIGITWAYDDGANTLTGDVNGFHQACVSVNTTTHTVTTEDIVLVDVVTAGADVTVTLPAAADRYDAVNDVAHPVTIKHQGDTPNNVVITPDGTEEIDGNAGTTTIKKGVSLTLKPDGTNWWII